MNRTKIICTIGPASRDPETVSYTHLTLPTNA